MTLQRRNSYNSPDGYKEGDGRWGTSCRLCCGTMKCGRSRPPPRAASPCSTGSWKTRSTDLWPLHLTVWGEEETDKDADGKLGILTLINELGGK